MRTTKSVWPLAAPSWRPTSGSTCRDPAYLSWVLELQQCGFEIGYHNATDGSSRRDETRRALDEFRDLFGHDPRSGADHAGNREALYCGPKRLTGAYRLLYQAAQQMLQPDRPRFEGESPVSPYFWGDLCRDRITYWRGLTFDAVNLFDVSPVLPYHDPRRAFVNYWFPAAHAPDGACLTSLLDDARMDRLESAGGVCIVFTHLGLGTSDHGRVHPELADRLTRLSARGGWFAPVSDILDHLRGRQPTSLISDRQRVLMESRWIVDRLRSGLPLGPTTQTTGDHP